LLSLAATTAMTWRPTLAEVTMRRTGFIHAGTRQDNQSLLDAFHDGLSALGWINGSNIAVVDRWAEDRTERLPGIIQEMVGAGVVVLVTAGTAATLAAKRASTALPVVLVAVDDPVAIGVVHSLATRRQCHRSVSDLVRNDHEAVAVAARACPRPASPRSHRQN
jgi:putative tryptophan/tyrosine transport system substrate-binding protein